MEKCKWSIRIFGVYFQYTIGNKFKIIAKQNGKYINN